MYKIRNRHFKLSERIIHILFLNSKYLSDLGLLTGKTGVVIAFAHLYRQTSNSIYDDWMEDLLDDVLEKTYKELSVDFASGFLGIGWGLEYLLQNGFVEGNGIEVCGELDFKIMEKDPRRMKDFSLETGLEGLLHYVLAHLHGAINTKSELPFDEIYLEDLYSAVKSIRQDDLSASLSLLADNYIGWYTDRVELNYQFNIELFIKDIEIDEKHFIGYPLGLREGLSGILLKQCQ